MEARSKSSHLISETSSDQGRANHILSLILSLRRPARPSELAARCYLFHASPELILYLCSIPDSPISLTGDLLVVPSQATVRAFVESLTSSDFVEAVLMQLGKRKRSLVVSESGFEVPWKKRLFLISYEAKEENEEQLSLQCTSQLVRNDATEYNERNINRVQCCMGQMVNGLLFSASLFRKYSVRQTGCQLTNYRFMEGESSMSKLRTVHEDTMECEPDPESAIIISTMENLHVPGGASENDMRIETRSMLKFILDGPEDRNAETLEAINVDEDHICPNVRISEDERAVEDKERENSATSCKILGDKKVLFQPGDTVFLDIPLCKDDPENVICESNGEEEIDRLSGTGDFPQASKVSNAKKLTTKSSSKMKNCMMVKSQRLKELCKPLEIFNAHDSKEKHRSKGDRKVSDKNKKLKEINDVDLHVRDSKRNSTSIPTKDQTKQTIFPKFESYVVQEEEGSGGYGTVYRAIKKNDGTTVAIKCPHAKAHKHHVVNEQRMLERFGFGKNSIIKYEGCIKSAESDCFILEHVEHDRPEVLKKEIDVAQLQWYGYCMFRALASLHKQGIVHRDIKPGNFLFSRKAGKGYLIDFNLAMDLFHNDGNRNDGKSKERCNIQNSHTRLSSEKYFQAKDRKLLNVGSLEAPIHKTTDSHKSKLDARNMRNKALAQTNTHNTDTGSWNVNKSQGADGSGITSAERIRQPLLTQRSKELLSLVQKTRETQNQILSPTRKRVVAPSQNIDKSLCYLTPMPLVSTGISVNLLNKGNGKSKREGPCAGTKGYRAPEVLFRSLFQGPKIDIWSAGVTLLYLIIGRTPFLGDPEQNLKDIAKLRGSEDLWEVAKLHNCESSFPKDLYKTESLPSKKLLDWCQTNTKRPDFLKEMPRSLIDLVEKCLTVNPRLRITAEEALRHDFFAPCHEALKRQRLKRQVLNQDSEISSLHGNSIPKPSTNPQVKI